MLIKSYIFGRKSRISAHNVVVQVDAFSKDHALTRLHEKWPGFPKTDWDFIDEVDPDDIGIGRMGDYLKLPRFNAPTTAQ